MKEMIVSSTTSTTSALLLKTSISPPTTGPEVTETLLSDVTTTPPGMTTTQPDPLPLSTEEMIFNKAQTEGQTSPKTTKKASCPGGFTKWRGTCYKAFGTPKKFWAANEHCRRYGGTLAMPKDAATNRRLISLMRRFIHQVFFFGLHDEGREGRFKWIDGTKLGSFSSWGPGEPNNHRGREDCVVYLRVYRKWNDFSCSNSGYFLCQVAPGRT
ncbi:PREDICTED: C-type lectin lectoxin-Lio2-like [Branchiostoma belcheri]|uniref:C-type lectin lectoxin-Lio2-like n=1 Tax=Branchiostoma belcheri TaxID=7741 RepID=A0A6P4YFB1_BRABE|nr:PREDICTED: C-type lectin lectoxin-Lio2-like [Branchiostoma belcheri]